MKYNLEEIIKKAIEGGWDWCKTYHYPPNSLFGELELEKISTDFYIAVLDPLFWKALGKACGWEKMVGEDIKLYKQDFADILEHRILSSGWIVYSLRFHEINLTKGWEKAVEYLKSIVVK